MTNFFRDKVVLVTGGGSGIGAELVRQMARDGAIVIAADLNLPSTESLASDLTSQGNRVYPLELNVCESEAFQDAVDVAIQEFGRLDILFNNAGVGLAGAVQDTKLSDWERIINVNLWGVINGVHAVYPVMLKQGFGQIVNMASAAGLAPRPGMVAYACSKSAVVGLSTSLREEAKGLGVSVNTVCPLTVATPIFKNTVYRSLNSESLLEAAPIKPFPLETAVERILAGVIANRSIINIQFLSWLEWWLYRIWPPLVALFVNPRRKLFRENRQASLP